MSTENLSGKELRPFQRIFGIFRFKKSQNISEFAPEEKNPTKVHDPSSIYDLEKEFLERLPSCIIFDRD